MGPRDPLAVTNHQVLQFFFEHLKDVTDEAAPRDELLYNASVLAHFAATSTASQESFPACPSSLLTVLDLFVLDPAGGHRDPEIMEAAASQCLLLTGFFQDQQKARHRVGWYAGLGVSFYRHAARASHDPARARLLGAMSQRFTFWQEQQHRLAIELREAPLLIVVPPASSKPF